MSFFMDYCFCCKDYGHRVDEYIKRSRNKNVVCLRSNAYGHSMSRCRNMHRSTPMHNKKSPFAASRNVNYVCYNCNGLGHRSHECRKR